MLWVSETVHVVTKHSYCESPFEVFVSHVPTRAVSVFLGVQQVHHVTAVLNMVRLWFWNRSSMEAQESWGCPGFLANLSWKPCFWWIRKVYVGQPFAPYSLCRDMRAAARKEEARGSAKAQLCPRSPWIFFWGLGLYGFPLSQSPVLYYFTTC